VRNRKLPLFKYYDDNSKKEFTDASFLRRVSKLKIPPNWSDVKISKKPTDYL
jgi:DNA topoisomerase IB